MKTEKNVDILLEEGSLELTIGGKVYTIVDIGLDAFLKMMGTKKTIEDSSDEASDEDLSVLHSQFANIVDVDISEIQNIGFKAIGIAMKFIQEWLYDTNSEELPDKKDAKPSRP